MLENWLERKSSDEFTINRTYPDGTDVIITIKKNNKLFEVWSNAEHRVSGPNEHLDYTVTSLEEATTKLWDEAKEWDEELL